MDISQFQPGTFNVTETSRRLQCEQSYGYIHALLGLYLMDGRVALSVTPGARPAILNLLEHIPGNSQASIDQGRLEEVVICINHVRIQDGLPPAKRAFECLVFACNGRLVRQYSHPNCHRLRDERIPAAEGLSLPSHCFPDGIVYGIVEDDRVVSVAYAHRTGKMEDQVADLAVETAEPYRRRGYARAVVSEVTAHITALGGEAAYSCSINNTPSIATALSVGYERYARMLVVSAPAPEGE